MSRLTAIVLSVLCLSASVASAQDVGGYVGTEWRVLGLGEHVSHGPSVSAGLTLLDRTLRVGITGFARPGPINPATFDATPTQPYRGQRTLSLRSDGMYFGLEVGLDLVVPDVSWLHVLPSVSAGYAAFGFYLTGDNRETPDGRRVSAWENELFDGRDAGFGLGIELALRLAFQLPDTPWVRITVGGGYLTIIGYDAYVRPSYDGPWATAGVEIDFPPQ